MAGPPQSPDSRCQLAMEDFTAGALSGLASLLVGHPFEVLKVQLQLSRCHPVGVQDAVTAMFDAGINYGVYRGLALPLASFTVVNSVFFGIYGQVLTELETMRADCHYGNVMLAGMAGGAAQLPLVTPIEVVKTAMQAQVMQSTRDRSELFRGPIHCALAIARREGLRGLNRGFVLTCARDVPSYGLYMLFYDWLVQTLPSHVIGDAPAICLAGGLAGSISWLSVLPIDTIKSNLQADAGVRGELRSGFSVARQLYHRHGARSFFRGGLVVAVRSFPVNAVVFYVWSRTLQLLKGPSSD